MVCVCVGGGGGGKVIGFWLSLNNTVNSEPKIENGMGMYLCLFPFCVGVFVDSWLNCRKVEDGENHQKSYIHDLWPAASPPIQTDIFVFERSCEAGRGSNTPPTLWNVVGERNIHLSPQKHKWVQWSPGNSAPLQTHARLIRFCGEKKTHFVAFGICIIVRIDSCGYNRRLYKHIRSVINYVYSKSQCGILKICNRTSSISTVIYQSIAETISSVVYGCTVIT